MVCLFRGLYVSPCASMGSHVRRGLLDYMIYIVGQNPASSSFQEDWLAKNYVNVFLYSGFFDHFYLLSKITAILHLHGFCCAPFLLWITNYEVFHMFKDFLCILKGRIM